MWLDLPDSDEHYIPPFVSGTLVESVTDKSFFGPAVFKSKRQHLLLNHAKGLV